MAATPERIFLSRKEALAAIRADFRQYAPQTRLFLDLFPLVFGDRAVISGTFHDKHLWMAEYGGKMFPIGARDLGLRLIRELEKTPPSVPELAAICRRVFRTTVTPGRLDRSAEAGLWLSTGMEGFSCRQCGHCCRFLDYYDQLTEADYKFWRSLNRVDILEKVRHTRREDNTIAYRVWERTVPAASAHSCPWLHKIPTRNRWQCLIHDVRPQVCRQYPGSRKHADMTGCPGFTAVTSQALKYQSGKKKLHCNTADD